MTGKVAVLPVTLEALPDGVLPARNEHGGSECEGPCNAPRSPRSVTVYDWMITLSSALER